MINLAAIGLTTGLVFSSYSVSPNSLPNQGGHTGFTIGAQAEFPVSGQIFFFHPELRYVQRGLSFSVGNTNGTFSLSELEIPLLAEAKLLPGAPVRPFFLFGPNFGFNTGSSASASNGNVTVNFNSQAFQPNTFDLGLDFAAGAEFSVAPKVSIIGEFRFTLGLLNQTGVSGESASYRGTQLLTGVNFAL